MVGSESWPDLHEDSSVRERLTRAHNYVMAAIHSVDDGELAAMDSWVELALDDLATCLPLPWTRTCQFGHHQECPGESVDSMDDSTLPCGCSCHVSSPQTPSRLTFVNASPTADGGLLVTVATSSIHPLCPRAAVIGPMALAPDRDGTALDPTSPQVQARIDIGLARLGAARTGDYQQHPAGVVAWVDSDPSLWPLRDADRVLADVEEGVFP